MPKDSIQLSVILPVYNKQHSIIVIAGLIKKLIEIDLGIDGYEIVYVDDCSTDDSLRILKEIKDEHIVVLEHKKNGGQLKAIETGLKAARGKVFAIYSCDMQNSFETIVPLYKAIAGGSDVAVGYRATRSDTGFGVLLSKLFFSILSAFEPQMPKGGFDFGLFNHYVYSRFIEKDFNNLFLQLEVLRISRKTYFLPTERINDTFDKSSWTIANKLNYAAKIFKYFFKNKSC